MAQNDTTKTTLSAEDFDAFKKKIDAPGRPTPALKEALRKSQEIIGAVPSDTDKQGS